MGLLLTIESDNGHQCPDWFTKTDSKSIATVLVELPTFGSTTPPGPLEALANHFDIDLTPLKKFAGDDWPLEEYLAACSSREEAEQQFERQNRVNSDAWQSPDDLIDCLKAITTSLNENPSFFSDVKISVDWQNNYVYKGFLLQDIEDLLHIIEWHKKDGAEKIRIMIL